MIFAVTKLRNRFFLSGNFIGEKSRRTPYEINVTIPVDGYDPVQFFLTKLCGELILYRYGLPLELKLSIELSLPLYNLFLKSFQNTTKEMKEDQRKDGLYLEFFPACT